jgi:hypothetical protein
MGKRVGRTGQAIGVVQTYMGAIYSYVYGFRFKLETLKALLRPSI